MIRPCVRRACIAATALTCLAGAAKAQSHRAEEAAALAADGAALLADGRLAEACERLSESVRREPHATPMLQLGECFEKRGLLAEAAETLRVSAGLPDAAPVAAEAARRHAAELEATLPRLVVVLDHPVAGLEVRRDGVLLPVSTLGDVAAVAPGEHVVSASAPGRRPWSMAVRVDGTTAVRVDVPELELALPDSGADLGVFLRPTTGTHLVLDAPAAPRAKATKLASLSLGLLGMASVGTSAFLGLRAKQISDSVEGRCRQQNGCDPNSSDLRQQAQRDAVASTVAFGLGAAAITTGALLWFLAPSKKRPHAAISPNLSFHRLAVTFSRTF